MAADPVETELKLEFDPADRNKLEAIAPLVSAEGKTDRLVSTYFDTADRDLARAGYSLRVRRTGRRRIQTIKSAGAASAGLFARTVCERSLHGDQPQIDEASGALIEAVSADALSRIEPVFVTDVRRAIFRIDAGGAAIEFAIDEGEIRAGERAEPLCEIELELRGGTPQALFDLARALNEQVPLRLGVRSKAERGYALLEDAAADAWKAESIALDRDGGAGEAFGTIAQACIRQFRLNEALLLQSVSAEALHQARVGLRRLRSAFSLFKPLYVDDPRAALLRAELHWLAAELGDVRNIDVLVARFEGDARKLLADARDRAFGHVRAGLVGTRSRLLLIDLAEWLTVGAWRTELAHPDRQHRRVTVFASEVLDVRRDRLERRGEGLSGLDREHRHKVRIEAKKLRYASEFFASLYIGDKARRRHERFLEALEALQEQLGELNDLVVGPQVLAKLGIDAKLPKSGKHRRERILAHAEEAYRALLRAKRFW